jgi:hypothetical protein
MRGLVIAGLLLLSRSAFAAEPWFVRKECMEATSLAYAAHLSESSAKAEVLRKSSDLALVACGLWLGVAAIEMEIALSDDETKLLEELRKSIDALEAFGVENGYRTQDFEDLVLEAKLRRVHLLVRLGERTDAIRAVKESKQILERRRRVKKATATYFYAEGIANLAITHADWATRAVLKLVGVEGDEERGNKAMKILLGSKTVYRPEVMIVARNFELSPKLELSDSLWREFPENPQLAFNCAMDLQEAQRCNEVHSRFEKVKLEGFGEKIRKKVTGVLALCKVE